MLNGRQESIVAFLDIGQGDATVILLPASREAILVDCGGGGGARTVLDYLEQAGVVTLPLIFMTHSDDDHVGGILEVLNNFRGSVGSLSFIPDRVVSKSDGPRYRRLLRGLGA